MSCKTLDMSSKVSAALKAAAPTAKLVDFDTTMRTTVST
jgi:hypothetical protein